MTVKTKSKEKESPGEDPSGVPVRLGESRGDGGRLSTSRANSRRVNAEWADHGGWGEGRLGKTAQLSGFLGPPYLCPRVLSPGQACQKHGVRVEEKKSGVRKEGTAGTKKRDSSLPRLRESG